MINFRFGTCVCGVCQLKNMSPGGWSDVSPGDLFNIHEDDFYWGFGEWNEDPEIWQHGPAKASIY